MSTNEISCLDYLPCPKVTYSKNKIYIGAYSSCSVKLAFKNKRGYSDKVAVVKEAVLAN